MNRPSDVLIVVPARDEAESLRRCLTSVCLALAEAHLAGVTGVTRVGVAAHRCTDGTASLARGVLEAHGVDHVVVEDERSTTVGEVRSRLVEAAMAASSLSPAQTWVLSTDADSRVPSDWVTGLLAVAHRTGADLVAGFVALDQWQAPAAARQAYDDLVHEGLTASGHEHVWAANLAVRHPALVAAGGFPSVPHGEERALADRVARSGTVVGSMHPTVVTSARMPGRAPHGLGDLLRDLARPAVVLPT